MQNRGCARVDETLFKDVTDEFMTKTTKIPEEIKSLIEVGFEYIFRKDDVLFFRKRK